MLAKEIAFYLQDQGMSLPGYELPDMPNDAMAVQEYAGARPWHVKGVQAAEIENPRFQILVRSGARNYVGGRQLIEDAYTFLDGFSGVLSGVEYVSIRAIQSPFPLGRDENGRWRFACNFEVLKALS
jgi:hypothetical protein